MKKALKALVLIGAAGIFSFAANAQTDNSKIEKVVLEEAGDSKTVEYSIKPEETKEVAIIEVKSGGTFVIKSSKQSPPEVKVDSSVANSGTQTINSGGSGSTMGSVIVNTNSINSATPDTSQAYANAPKTSLSAKTNWILKKDGRQIGNGTDALEYVFLGGRPVNVKYESDAVPMLEPGIYTVAVKCVQKTACEDKLTLTLTAGMLPDPANMGP